MTDSPYVFDVTEADFQQYVLQNSFQAPVLVDFWADWCQPCKTLMPLLAKLAEEYQGGFLLAKVNSDTQQALAARHGVRSLPTVKVFKDGQVVDEFMGALPESEVRAVINKYVLRESDKVHQAALQALEAGDTVTALELLNKAAEMDPANTEVRVDLAVLLANNGDANAARKLLEALPAEVQAKEEIKALLSQLKFVDLAAGLPDVASLQARLDQDPKDTEAAYELAMHALLAGDHEAAMDQLLAIIMRDRAFKDDLARTTLLEIFNMLGDDPLVKHYRRRLFTALH